MVRNIQLLATLILLLRSTTADPAPIPVPEPQRFSPFVAPKARNRPLLLFKRQSSCPSDYTQCSSISAPEACCPSGTNCARDQQGNVACCPFNNYCTGVIGSVGTSISTTSQTNSVAGGGVVTVTVTSTAGVTDSQSATTPAITGSVAGGGSTVPNAYYPFVYLPTAFANAAICSSYYTSCQTASTSCFQSLGGINGVTIGGMVGGTTQTGSSGLAQTSASSICSSLSLSACYGLQSTQCAQFGSTGATGTSFVQLGRGPRETGCVGMVYMAAAGAAVGLLGMAG